MSLWNRMGQPVRVTLELPDGTLWAGQAMCAEVQQQMDIDRLYGFGGGNNRFLPGRLEWTIELRGIGDLSFKSPTEYRHKVKKTKSAIEWVCDWCGSITPREHRKCESCGGARSFVYE